MTNENGQLPLTGEAANALPNLIETDIDDVWRFRQEWADSESYAKERRRHADQEILRRAAQKDAQVLGTAAGDITITLPNTYSYNSAIVDGEFFALVERDNLQEDYNLHVSHNYKITRPWLNRLMKRGKEYVEVVDKMTNAGTGSPSIAGPPLDELGDYIGENPIPEEATA